jgi:hypothetical protein
VLPFQKTVTFYSFGGRIFEHALKFVNSVRMISGNNELLFVATVNFTSYRSLSILEVLSKY